MSGLLLTFVLLTGGIQGILIKKYSNQKDCGMYTYYFISTVFALIVFLFQSGFKIKLVPEILLYSVLFAVAYCSAIVFQFVALKHGPLSLTILITSYSLILPTLYGIFFLKERFTVIMAAGIVLFVISLALAVEIKRENKKISLLWFVAVSLAFIGNGMCAMVQKIQQIEFEGQYKGELMIFALLLVALFMLVMALIGERQILINSVKRGWYLAAPLGAANGLNNLLVLILNNMIPAAVLFPVVSAGGVVISSVAGVFVFKEKLSRTQLAGVIIGILAIVLLNI